MSPPGCLVKRNLHVSFSGAQQLLIITVPCSPDQARPIPMSEQGGQTLAENDAAQQAYLLREFQRLGASIDARAERLARRRYLWDRRR
jgi:hypothetical protein